MILLTEDEIQALPKAMTVQPRPKPSVATREQLKKIAEWGDEPCFEHLSWMGGLPVKRHSCEICWEALKKEAGL